MTHGLLRAGIDIIAGVDNHLPCAASYQNSSNNTRPCGEPPTFIHADVASPQLTDRLRQLGVSADADELVFAGCSPCQYWSKINTSRARSRQSRLLLTSFQQLTEIFRPGYLVIENVPGLESRREESGLQQFLELLSRAGYAWEERVVALFHYGVPQKRHRYLLIATRLSSPGDQPSINLPCADNSTHGHPESMKLKHFIGTWNGFPAIAAGERLNTPPMHWSAALSEKNLRRIQMTKPDGGSRMDWKDDPDLQIDAYRGRDNMFSDVYGRMRWDEPAPTITTRFNSLSNGRFGHPTENRAISLREGATLQTFPASYLFPSSLPEAARQIGNAVPPELSYRIGRQIVAHHAGIVNRNAHGQI